LLPVHLLIKLLKAGGVTEPAGAIHGLNAFELYRASPERYSLVFMDVMMPVLEVIAATSQIRAFEQELQLERVPIIGLTAMDNREECLAAGMDDFYRKPKNRTLEALRFAFLGIYSLLLLRGLAHDRQY
jgi:CheY-like chemotaxis protein